MDVYNLNESLDEFQKSLSAEQKAEFQRISSEPPRPEDISDLLNRIKKESSKRKSYRCAERLRTILEHINQYCAIVDCMIQANPTVAALVWGSAKFLILVATNFAEYFDKLSNRLCQLISLVPRLREYEKIFHDSARLRNAISTFYAIVVAIFTKSLRFLQEKGVLRFFKFTWKSFKSDFGQLEGHLSMAKDEVDEEIKLASEQEAYKSRTQQQIQFDQIREIGTRQEIEISQSTTFRARQVDEIEENKRHRSEQRMALAQTQAMTIQKIVKTDERHRIRLRAKVSVYDYTWSLRVVRRNRCDETRMWFFKRQEFTEWKHEIFPTCLWFSGFGMWSHLIKPSLVKD